MNYVPEGAFSAYADVTRYTRPLSLFPRHFQFIIHIHLNTGHQVVWVTKNVVKHCVIKMLGMQYFQQTVYVDVGTAWSVPRVSRASCRGESLVLWSDVLMWCASTVGSLCT
jgi:hypothetical protein